MKVRPHLPLRSKTIIPPEELAPARLENARAMLQNCGVPGALMGVLEGGAEWDLRPLVVHQARVAILRQIAPEMQGKASRTLHDAYVRLSHAGLLGRSRFGLLGSGAENRFWLLREYENATLADESARQAVHAAGLSKLKAFYQQLEKLHQLGAVHGHICPGNIGWNGVQCVLLDLGFAVSEEVVFTDRWSAPELAAGRAVTAAADDWSFARVLEQNFAELIDPERRARFAEVLADDEQARERVAVIFSSAAAPMMNVGQGKLLGGGFVQPPPVQPSAASGKLLARPEPRPRFEPPPPPRSVVGRIESRAPSVFQVETAPIISARQQAPAPDPAPQERLPDPELTPAPPPQPDVVIRRAPPPAPRSSISAKVLLSFIIGLILAAISYRLLLREPSLPYADYWGSGNPDLMRKVAAVAVAHPRGQAVQAILHDLDSGADRPLVRSAALRMLYSRNLLADLSDSDLSYLFGYIFAELVPDRRPDPAKIRDVAPEVILGIAAALPLDAAAQDLAPVLTAELGALPAPLGQAFTSLSEVGFTQMSAGEPRAFAYLIGGFFAPEVLSLYFGPAPVTNVEQSSRIAALIRILLPIVPEKGDSAGRVLNVLRSYGDVVLERLNWFLNPEIDLWGGAPELSRLYLASGALPPFEVSTEQLLDLLTYPSASVRREAAERVRGRMPEISQGVITYLGQRDAPSRIGRLQLLTLMAAMQMQSNERESFFARWFETNPDPSAVAEIIAETVDRFDLAALHLHGARYLRNRSWEVAPEQLQKLSQHSEPLARGLAYSKLDASNPDHIQILQSAVLREQEPRLKQLIENKINDALKAL